MLWLVLAAMTAVVLALLLWPMLRGGEHGRARRDYDLAVYRRQLAELEAESSRGLIEAAAAEEARHEIERRLLSAGQREEARPPVGSSWRQAVVWALLLLLPAGAGGLYFLLGQPTVPGAPWSGRQTTAAADAETTALVQQLAERMRAHPDDPRGWRLLGRSYLALGRYVEAGDAFSKVLALDPVDLTARVDLAEALTLAADGIVTPAARAGFEAVLKEAPQTPRPRYYLGLAAWQAGRPQEAYDRWLALARDAPPDAPWLPLLRARLARTAKELGIDLTADLRPRPAQQGAGTPGPSPTDLEAAANLSPAERQAFVRSMVERLAARLEQTPEDFEGWMRLGRARRVLGDAAAAAEAYGRAAALRPEDPAALAAQASALIAAAPGDAPPEAAIEAYRRVLRLDPERAEALLLTGLADAGRTEAAIAAWERLLPKLDPASPEYRALSEALAKARARLQ